MRRPARLVEHYQQSAIDADERMSRMEKFLKAYESPASAEEAPEEWRAPRKFVLLEDGEEIGSVTSTSVDEVEAHIHARVVDFRRYEQRPERVVIGYVCEETGERGRVLVEDDA